MPLYKIWSWVGAISFLIAGMVLAFFHYYWQMALLFVLMSYCLGFALRGRNSWVK